MTQSSGQPPQEPQQPQGNPYQQPQQGQPQQGQPQQGQYGNPQGNQYGNPQGNQYAGQGSQNPQGAPAPRQGQPQQGQPQPGPGQYGNEGYGNQAAPPSTTTATTKQSFSPAVAVMAAIAAVLGILSLFVFAWYRKDYGSVSGGSNASKNTTFHKLHELVNTLQNRVDANPSVDKYVHLGIGPTYFGWLGYVLIAAAVVLTFITAAPLGGVVVAIKWVSALVAAAGIGLTLWAIDLFTFDAPLARQINDPTLPKGYGDWIKHTSFGAWAMGLAFLLCLIGSLLPPKRRTVVSTTNQPGQSGRY